MRRAKYTESAGGVVVNNMTGDVLVVRQANNVWSLPKGHIESNEDPLTTAKREIFEESGVTKVHLIKELGQYKRFKIGQFSKDDESEIKTIRMYLFTTDQQDVHPFDESHPEAKWVPRKEVSNILTHKKDKAFFVGVFDELPPEPEQS